MNRRAKRIRKKSVRYFNRVAKREEVISEPALCYESVLERLEICKGGRLLDVGCGNGIMLSEIAKRFPDKFTLYGLDLSDESIRRAKALCGDHAVFDEGDSGNLPYDSGAFDILLCMHSFHHYPHPLQSLREMNRVLAADGMLYLVENDYSDYQRARINVRLIALRHPRGDIRMYSRRAISALASIAGFRVESHRKIADHSQILECRK